MSHPATTILGALGCALAGLLAGCGAAHEAAPAAAEPAEAAATCQVRVAAIVEDALEVALPAAGTVAIAAPGIRVASAPADCRVRAVLVAPGQALVAGATLVELEPGVEVLAQQTEAVAVRAAARRDLEQAQARLAAQLATRLELGQAQAALELAEVRAAAAAQRVAAASALTCDAACQVTKVTAQAGQLVPAGTVLVELAIPGHLEVRLGLDPDQARRIAPGQRVLLRPARAAETPPLELAVAALAGQLTADTRLRDAVVAIPDSAGLVAGEYLTAELPLRAARALVVPRTALVQGDDGWAVFTVHDGKAARHAVTVAAETRERAALVGAGLAAGDQVVVEGAAELADAMAVAIVAESGKTGAAKAGGAGEDEQPDKDAKDAKDAKEPAK